MCPTRDISRLCSCKHYLHTALVFPCRSCEMLSPVPTLPSLRRHATESIGLEKRFRLPTPTFDNTPYSGYSPIFLPTIFGSSIVDVSQLPPTLFSPSLSSKSPYHLSSPSITSDFEHPARFSSDSSKISTPGSSSPDPTDLHRTESSQSPTAYSSRTSRGDDLSPHSHAYFKIGATKLAHKTKTVRIHNASTGNTALSTSNGSSCNYNSNRQTSPTESYPTPGERFQTPGPRNTTLHTHKPVLSGKSRYRTAYEHQHCQSQAHMHRHSAQEPNHSNRRELLPTHTTGQPTRQILTSDFLTSGFRTHRLPTVDFPTPSEAAMPTPSPVPHIPSLQRHSTEAFGMHMRTRQATPNGEDESLLSPLDIHMHEVPSPNSFKAMSTQILGRALLKRRAAELIDPHNANAKRQRRGESTENRHYLGSPAQLQAPSRVHNLQNSPLTLSIFHSPGRNNQYGLSNTFGGSPVFGMGNFGQSLQSPPVFRQNIFSSPPARVLEQSPVFAKGTHPSGVPQRYGIIASPSFLEHPHTEASQGPHPASIAHHFESKKAKETPDLRSPSTTHQTIFSILQEGSSRSQQGCSNVMPRNSNGAVLTPRTGAFWIGI